ncbi:MAG: hypothetical protein EZS28_053884, partial [Streblomastix strix]
RNLEACIEAYDWTSLIKYVDIETCLGLKKQIQSNKATVRQRLVRVVMAIVERGADGPYSEGKNQFYYPILKSDLDDEIKEIVRQLQHFCTSTAIKDYLIQYSNIHNLFSRHTSIL